MIILKMIIFKPATENFFFRVYLQNFLFAAHYPRLVKKLVPNWNIDLHVFITNLQTLYHGYEKGNIKRKITIHSLLYQ